MSRRNNSPMSYQLKEQIAQELGFSGTLQQEGFGGVSISGTQSPCEQHDLIQFIRKSEGLISLDKAFAFSFHLCVLWLHLFVLVFKRSKTSISH